MSAALRRRLLDVAPAVVVAAIGLGQLVADYGGSGYRGPRVANAAFVLATCAPLVIRRRHPVAALACVFLAQAAWMLTCYRGPQQPPFEPFLAAVVACFALGYHADRRGLRLGLGFFALLVAANAVVLAAGGTKVGDAIPLLVWWLVAIGVGRGLSARQELVDLLRERSARLELDRGREMAEAALEERARIARELHDVIAHAVSVMVVQASAERRLLGPDQRRTAETLETIEGSGREALGELRRLLGVLRARGPERLAPQPGLGAVGELMDDARRAGQRVALSVEGEQVRLPVGLDLTAYRIVQEALTNARKHASGAAVRISLRWDVAQLEIEVADDGPARAAVEAANGHGTGHGLIGMRERVALYGGSLVAERSQAGGFRIRAVLPVEPGAGP
ncbi:MAG TPA: sensor histidine kinase [Solirubrobacteraceae bacterium]|nr:sensor histidine kinase [Solirubrobacteraceae bacterium]